jgi:hypothetical protein
MLRFTPYTKCCCSEFHYAERRYKCAFIQNFFARSVVILGDDNANISMLNIVILRAVMLNVIMVAVIIPSVLLLSAWMTFL